jgi:MFS family permease
MALVQGPLLTKISKVASESNLILFDGLMWPSVLSLLSQTTDEKFQGMIQGFAGSMGSIASIIGLLMGGVLYTRVTGLIFLISAIIIFFVFIISLSFKYQIEKKHSN